MEKHEFLRKVADSGDRQVVLQYAESTATFYVKRLASFNSTVATDDVVETLRRMGVRIIGVPVMKHSPMPAKLYDVHCSVCGGIVSRKTYETDAYMCAPCAARALGISLDAYEAYNPTWLVDAIEDAKEFNGC